MGEGAVGRGKRGVTARSKTRERDHRRDKAHKHLTSLPPGLGERKRGGEFPNYVLEGHLFKGKKQLTANGERKRTALSRAAPSIPLQGTRMSRGGGLAPR